MMVRSMIDNKVHDDFEPDLMRRLEQTIPVLHCAKVWVDRLVVGDVVAHVYHRRSVDWRKPYDVYPEVFQVVEF